LTDFNILIGASRNSLEAGLLDGIRGTDALVQISTALSRLFQNKDWHPRRTIRFISWGGADFGQLGFTEFLEVRRHIEMDRHADGCDETQRYMQSDRQMKIQRHADKHGYIHSFI